MVLQMQRGVNLSIQGLILMGNRKDSRQQLIKEKKPSAHHFPSPTNSTLKDKKAQDRRVVLRKTTPALWKEVEEKSKDSASPSRELRSRQLALY